MRQGEDGSPALVFQGQGLSTDYTGRNVYVVTAGGGNVPLRVPLTRSASAVAPGTVRVEKSTIYLPLAPLGTDPWLWENLLPDWGDWPYTWWDPTAGDFDIPGLPQGTAGEVRVRVRLMGFSEDEHRITARINGQPIGELVFDGKTSATLEGTVMAETLAATGNQLSLSYSASTLATGEPNPWASAYLDALELDVPTLSPAAPVPILSVAGYGPDLPSFDGIAVPDRDALSLRRAGRRDRRAEAGRGLARPRWSRSTRPTTTSPRASSRRARSRRSSRTPAPAARAASRYVLLVGDDSFDTHDYVGSGGIAFVPSLVAWDGEFGRIPSENRYADTDDDGRPDVAIGRLPVQTLDEADVLVDKIAAQTDTLAAAAGRHLFVTDNSSDEDAPFRDDADAVVATLPAGSVVLPIADATAGADAARQALDGRLAAGRRADALLRPRRHHDLGGRAAALRGHGRERHRQRSRPPCSSRGPASRSSTRTSGGPRSTRRCCCCRTAGRSRASGRPASARRARSSR